MMKKIFILLIPIILGVYALGRFTNDEKNLMPGNDVYLVDYNINSFNNSIDILQIESKHIKGINRIFYYDGENRIIINKQDNAFSEKSIINHQDYNRRFFGNLFTYDMEEELFEIVPSGFRIFNTMDLSDNAGYSPNGEFVDYRFDNKNYIYNMNTGTSAEYSTDKSYRFWSEDSSKLIEVRNKPDEKGQVYLKVYDTNGELVRGTYLNGYGYSISTTPAMYSKTGDEIICCGFIRRGSKEEGGLFAVDTKSGYVEDLLVENEVREEEGKSVALWIGDFQCLPDESIIIEAIIGSELALYRFDLNYKELKKLMVLSGYADFKVSPDMSKIAFSISDYWGKKTSDNEKHTYVGNMRENTIEDITYVKKTFVGSYFQWSNDSRTLVFIDKEKEKLNVVNLR